MWTQACSTYFISDSGSDVLVSRAGNRVRKRGLDAEFQEALILKATQGQKRSLRVNASLNFAPKALHLPVASPGVAAERQCPLF